MIDPPLPPDPLVQHWLQRHRTWTSFILHMIGIPPTILGSSSCRSISPCSRCRSSSLPWRFSSAAIILQFAGHVLEGTDPGEIIYFKRKLGLPYVEFPQPRPRALSGRS